MVSSTITILLLLPGPLLWRRAFRRLTARRSLRRIGMSSANIEVSEIQPQLSRAEQEAAAQYANGHADVAIEILVGK